uniref:CSON004823 protein n=1 Tax=Culicoides sonorensis TaxID=179676 RepID=A0A336MPI1_CULSO
MDESDTQPCRICKKLRNTHEMQLVSDQKLKPKIETICGITIRNEDEQKFLCNECEITIESSFRLRELAQEEATVKNEESDHYDTEITDDLDERISEADFDDGSEIPIEYCKDSTESIIIVKEESPTFDDTIESLQDHETIQIISELTCKFCDQIIDELNFQEHIKECNGDSMNYECIIFDCDKQFKLLQSLNIHVASRHFNIKPFQCHHCDKTFASKDTLKGHMVAHLSERKEICFVCGAKFKSKLSLYKHKVIHENREYRCYVCNAKFKTKYDCTYHERVKHLGQPVKKKEPNRVFTCDLCEKVYKSNESLKRHTIRVHRNIKDFICWVEGCNASYGFHSNLKKHILKSHPEIDLTGIRILPDPRAYDAAQNQMTNILNFIPSTQNHIKEESMNE